MLSKYIFMFWNFFSGKEHFEISSVSQAGYRCLESIDVWGRIQPNLGKILMLRKYIYAWRHIQPNLDKVWLFMK